jgi:ribosomal protein L36
MKMLTKKEIQQRVLQNGKPLALNKFSWDGETETFSTKENDLVIDFSGLDYLTIKSGHNSTVTCGYRSTVTCGHWSTVTCGDGSNVTCGYSSNVTCGHRSTVTCWDGSNVTCGDGSTVTCGYRSTVTCGYRSTVTCGEDSNVTCGDGSTVTCGEECVIVRRGGVFEVIQPMAGDIIQICPYEIKGHLKNGLLNGEPHIIADGILSKIIKRKGNVYKVINHGQSEQSYLIKRGNDYAHGKTLKDAREALIYKISDRDTSKYDDLTLESILSKEEAIQCYIVITGSCSEGTKYFVDRQDDLKDEYSIKDIIELTQGQFGNDTFKQFFSGE